MSIDAPTFDARNTQRPFPELKFTEDDLADAIELIRAGNIVALFVDMKPVHQSSRNLTPYKRRAGMESQSSRNRENVSPYTRTNWREYRVFHNLETADPLTARVVYFDCKENPEAFLDGGWEKTIHEKIPTVREPLFGDPLKNKVITYGFSHIDYGFIKKMT